MSAPVDVLAVLDDWATNEALLGHDFNKADRIAAVRAAVADLIECAKLARPAGEVGWPSALILEPPHAVRFRAALAKVQP